MNANRAEVSDVVELIREGPAPYNYVPEQERNFDNKTMPERAPRVVRGTTLIDGKLYNIVDYS